MLSSEELKRYNRHIILSEFGQEAQEKLKKAKVLVVGAGGLGCPVLLYLAAAGVGTIGIVDFDVVDESNLQRQILYFVEDIGKPKAEIAARRLKEFNPHVQFNVHNLLLNKENILPILKEYDLVADGSDNFATRYLVSDATVILNKPLVFGSIFKFEGQVSVFNLKEKKGPTYRCLFPEPPGEGEVPGCSETGVLGVLPGIIGTIQANEVIKVITGIGEPLSGRLFVLDALSMETSIIRFAAIEENYRIKELGNYDVICGYPERKRSISVQDLKEKMDKGEELIMVDVREASEHDLWNLGGLLIPLNSLGKNYSKIPRDKQVIVYCHHGMRSAAAVKYLEQEHGYTNLMNLEGGIHAWALQVDPEIPLY